MFVSVSRARRVGLGVAVCLACAARLLAANIDYKAVRQDRRLPAVRATGPITVDGVLDEADWTRAPVAKGFIQNDPREDEPASNDTEVRVLYDATNIYLGIFAHQDPKQIITNDLTKDFTRDAGDGVEVVFDTFHDERNGYMFATNAMGAKWDGQMISEGRETNENWDALWTVKTRVTESGWYAEFAIPFRTLRFSNADPQTWGINFKRRIRGRNEESYWSPLPRIYDLNRVSLAGTLEGLQGVRPGNDLRFKPYILGSSGKTATTGVINDKDIGFDAKYGVTPGLTWDFTVNTDFSQVEADEQQVNLSRFSLFFPEKREFFLENSGVFQFGVNDRGGGGAAGAGGGRQNNINLDVLPFFSRRIGLSDSGTSIPIVGGTRLTGRVGSYALGVLNIQQRSTQTTLATNFTAIRLRRNVLRNSDVGFLVLNKDEDGPRYNRVVGTDANFRFFQNLNLEGFAAKTFSPQIVMPGRGGEVMARAGVNYRDNLWDLQGSYLTVGNRANDEMGFVTRTGINKDHYRFGAHVRPTRVRRWIREMFPHIELQDVYRSGNLDSRYVDYHHLVQFQNGSNAEVGVNASTEVLTVPFQINTRRNVIVPPGRYDFFEWFSSGRTSTAAPTSVNWRWSTGRFYDGYKHSTQIGGTVRPNARLTASMVVSWNGISLKGGQYSTNLITTRVDYAFSTRTFLNALVQYNTDARQWSSNVRFNVIHRPLSDFFFVYNERHDTTTGDLLDRALIAKMTYMVAF
jgi:Domain of unknown function (DUF5916)/Carbohydrate family 9 binding domain-like